MQVKNKKKVRKTKRFTYFLLRLKICFLE